MGRAIIRRLESLWNFSLKVVQMEGILLSSIGDGNAGNALIIDHAIAS